MKRREFLNRMMIGTGGLLLSQIPFNRSLAGTTQNRVFVTVFLRGGWDALNVLPPIKGNDLNKYKLLRKKVRVEGASNITHLDDELGFGLNKALGQYLKPIWDDKKLAIIPRAGSINETRSHFVQSDLIETGSSTIAESQGYLARARSLLTQDETDALNYMAFGLRQPQSFRGSAPIVLEDVHSFGSLSKSEIISAESTKEKLQRFMMDDSQNCKVIPGERTIDFSLCNNVRKSKRMLDEVAALKEKISLNLPSDFTSDQFGKSFYQATQVIKYHHKVRFINIDQGGYDTHFEQGAGSQEGKLVSNLTALGKNLKAFVDQLQADGQFQRVTVLVMSEFGRTTRENSNMGTDHGRGGVALVLGGHVRGGTNQSKYGARKTWSFNEIEIAEGSSRALNLDKTIGSKPQHDLRHISARILNHVLEKPYSEIRQLYVGASLPDKDDDQLKLFV
jgi:uncharacterized protein (DUF1501 family)